MGNVQRIIAAKSAAALRRVAPAGQSAPSNVGWSQRGPRLPLVVASQSARATKSARDIGKHSRCVPEPTAHKTPTPTEETRRRDPRVETASSVSAAAEAASNIASGYAHSSRDLPSAGVETTMSSADAREYHSLVALAASSSSSRRRRRRVMKKVTRASGTSNRQVAMLA